VVGLIAACAGMVLIGNDLMPVTAEATRKRMDAALDRARLTDADRAMIRAELDRLVVAFEEDRIGYAPVSEYLERFGTSDVLRVGLLRLWQQRLQESERLPAVLQRDAIAATDRYIAATMRGTEDPAAGKALAEAWTLHGEPHVLDPEYVRERISHFESTRKTPPGGLPEEPLPFDTFVAQHIDRCLDES